MIQARTALKTRHASSSRTSKKAFFPSAEALVSAFNNFRGERELNDNLTIVAIQFAPQPAARVKQPQPT